MRGFGLDVFEVLCGALPVAGEEEALGVFGLAEDADPEVEEGVGGGDSGGDGLDAR